MREIKKVLVANRGEIALRIMRTLKKMGIKSVAVYSEVDRKAPFVMYADEGYLLGPAPSSESYLVQEKIIDIAKKAKVDGIHPGYGFLSENAVFAAKVDKAGIKFIGPSIHAIEIMGSKLAAKEAVSKYDIPMVPGIDHAIEDVNEGYELGKKIGYPILIKASAGGGGKGMRVVQEESELAEQMERAISEAVSAFGDGAVFMEKFVTSPRHIEIQILADAHGNVVHLFERECSIQRRHQKVIEEAPSSILTPSLRDEMGKAAVKVAQSCQYEGAGTVEFLLDEHMNFYFLEMNTRLQVEHPVTEMITGMDIVEQQIYIAQGKPLSYKQEDIKMEGHAMEVRVYAEDPLNNFLPSIGTLETYKIPSGEGIRVDDAFEEGMEVPIYYDPMIAKLVTYAPTRILAIEKMNYAIRNYTIEGIKTTLPFGQFVMHHSAFLSGDFDTNFVSTYFTPEGRQKDQAEEKELAAKVALKLFLDNSKKLKI